MVTSTAVQVHLDETALIECHNNEAFGWIRLSDFPTTVDLFLGGNDESAINAADRLIEALQKVRAAALARIVKSAA